MARKEEGGRGNTSEAVKQQSDLWFSRWGGYSVGPNEERGQRINIKLRIPFLGLRGRTGEKEVNEIICPFVKTELSSFVCLFFSQG